MTKIKTAVRKEQAMCKIENYCMVSVKCCLIITMVILCLVLFGCTGSAKYSKQLKFASYEEAVDVFVKAMRDYNKDELLRILGDDGKELIRSGDEIMDKHTFEVFLNAYDERHKISSEGEKKILIVGEKEWPFPIPIINIDGQWKFDTAAGKEEILNRRVGRNELDTIQVMLAIVDAQREYAMKIHDQEGVRQYAQKFMSDDGKKNGLYWQAKEGEEQSPLGPLVADAWDKGYFDKETSKKQSPYHGYYYRMLKGQGENAQGGEFDYVVNGKMIGGFAVIAYPAEYGNSGVMTFMVNHDGTVYQKDLGDATMRKAKKIKIFDPDKTWEKVQQQELNY